MLVELKDRVQDVKKLVKEIKQVGRSELTCRVIFGPADSWDDGFLRAGGSDEEGTIVMTH